ncbi:thiamine phosphate synthase [Actinomyces sp. ZJ308]|uniref:thiamine phosphate synthase n=1 Tax=Actinomyces sp. ZJ308 TaxID=2708342 RepID=UPI00141FF9F5|nr:thiamine phosphate synthase [Actinomyces sp. ZJ308]
MRAAPDLSLYLVTDEDQCRSRGRDVVRTVEAAVDGGVTCVQLRAKDADGGPFLTQVLEVAEAVGGQVPVIVNDRVDVFLAARDLGARIAGVHLGQLDLPAGVARRLIGDEAYLGLSTATRSEMCAAQEQGACDYVGIGVVRDTATKADAPKSLGINGVVRMSALTDLPAVAIGGVTVADLPALRAGGLDGAAVVSAICTAEDPRRAAAALRAAWDGGDGR